ncbi:MAG TPA: Asp-tRNA(Asn)/Glu-tRNA(Gln) amidotransferase GatCAB subunit B, partial [Burkholderiaceae bacterium]|nr:Asp-tRNA(Asn)/Glu-tRNA(Gln) amidotransferase GatCAB subunit B [Burkholderiaceae bacterium]
NSFRFLERAIEFEVQRQIDLIEDGGAVVQETRLYDSERDETRAMRGKEDAMDYRYFPDPDLLPLAIANDWIERVRQAMPELPGAMRERFERQYGLPAYDAQTLTASRDVASYFESVAAHVSDKKMAANWVMGELAANLNESGLAIKDAPVSATQLGELIARVLDGTISSKTAKEVFAALWEQPGASADAIIETRGLKQISDLTAIEGIVDQVLSANSSSVDEFRAGKEKAFNALVGQAMKATRGKANPQQVNEILRRKLAS